MWQYKYMTVCDKGLVGNEATDRGITDLLTPSMAYSCMPVCVIVAMSSVSCITLGKLSGGYEVTSYSWLVQSNGPKCMVNVLESLYTYCVLKAAVLCQLIFFFFLYTVAQFMHVLRQRIQLGATESIFLMVNGVTPTTRWVCDIFVHWCALIEIGALCGKLLCRLRSVDVSVHAEICYLPGLYIIWTQLF